MKVLWYMNQADGVMPWVAQGRYDVSHERMRELAVTIDEAGFYGALAVGRGTTGAGSEGMLESASLIPLTHRMRFLVPIYPGVIPVALLAQYARQFDSLSQGRLLFNQVNGTDPILERYGVYLSKSERYALSEEYFEQFKRLYAEGNDGFEGHYLKFGKVPGNRTLITLNSQRQTPHTPVWGSGASPDGIRHAGKVLDAYLTYLHRPDKLGAQIQAARHEAARHGRRLQVGTLANIIVRETEQEAWDHAQHLLDATGAQAIAQQVDARLKFREFESGGIAAMHSDDPAVQARIEALRASQVPRARDLQFSSAMWSGPSLWAPIDLQARGWGDYLIGTPQQVADKMRELRDTLGIDIFILAGWPLKEEAERTARLLLPLLQLSHDAPTLAAAA